MKLSLSRLICLIGLGAVAATAGPITFNFTISGVDTGNFAITESSGTITNITGTFDGSTISSLLGTGTFSSNDNLFFTPAPYLDFGGVSFSLAVPDTFGNSYVNLYYPGGGVYETLQSPTSSPLLGGYNAPDTLTLAPEPGTLTLASIGIAILFARRKRMGQDRSPLC